MRLMPRTQGIYMITNTVTAETYIGSSVDIAKRWSDHRWHLKNNRHKNALLQAAYDRDGLNAFHLGVLEHVEQAVQLVYREQHYLDLLKPTYNGDEVAIRAPYRTWRSDEADRERFWSKVDQVEDGCWLWQGTMLRQGYGCFKIAGKMHKAHRVAYTLVMGVIPSGLLVCHHCDNRSCVRPDHLFLGTTKDNVQDAKKKGRLATGDRSGARLHSERMTRGAAHWSHLYPERHRGELNGRARLTREQVEDIRTRYATSTASQFILADEYHVVQTTISAIVRNKNWRE